MDGQCNCRIGGGDAHEGTCSIWRQPPTPTERFLESLRAFHRAAAELDSIAENGNVSEPLRGEAKCLTEFLEKQVSATLDAWNRNLNPGDKRVFACGYEDASDDCDCELYTTNSDEHLGVGHVCDTCMCLRRDHGANRSDA